MSQYFLAALLGVIEGLTEFLPVSSTGHLILAGHFFGFESKGKTFEVLVQLGAILAILLVYFRRLLDLAMRVPSDPGARRFVIGVLVGFLPAVIVGLFLHKYIKQLFDQPIWVCVALILGGLVLLAVDFMRLNPRYHSVEEFPIPLALENRSLPVPRHVSRRLAIGRDDRGRDADGGEQAGRRRVLVLPGDADDGRRLRLRSLQELQEPGHQRRHA